MAILSRAGVNINELPGPASPGVAVGLDRIPPARWQARRAMTVSRHPNRFHAACRDTGRSPRPCRPPPRYANADRSPR